MTDVRRYGYAMLGPELTVVVPYNGDLYVELAGETSSEMFAHRDRWQRKLLEFGGRVYAYDRVDLDRRRVYFRLAPIARILSPVHLAPIARILSPEEKP